MRRSPPRAALRFRAPQPRCLRAPAPPPRPGSRAAGRATTPWPGLGSPQSPSRTLRKLGEVRFAFLHVRVAALLRLFAHVIEQGRIARQLLDAGEAVISSIESSLEHSQRERAELQH